MEGFPKKIQKNLQSFLRVKDKLSIETIILKDTFLHHLENM